MAGLSSDQRDRGCLSAGPVRAGTQGRGCAGPGGLQSTSAHEEVALAQVGGLERKGRCGPSLPGTATSHPFTHLTNHRVPLACSAASMDLVPQALVSQTPRLAAAARPPQLAPTTPHPGAAVCRPSRHPSAWPGALPQAATAHLPGPGQEPALRPRPPGGRKGLYLEEGGGARDCTRELARWAQDPL